jgi:hypothetical protein
LIESTIQQSIVSINIKEPDCYALLGGGKTPREKWEAYENELKDLDDESQEARHNRLLIDKSGKTEANATAETRIGRIQAIVIQPATAIQMTTAKVISSTTKTENTSRPTL